MRRSAQAKIGDEDEAHLLRVERVSRAFELVGRGLLHFGVGPMSFVAGTLCLSVYKQLQNAEIGHVCLHGTYDRFPRLHKFHRKNFRWQAPVHEDSWVALHNSVHHPFNNIAGKDPDHHFGPIRLSELTSWRRYHRFNLQLMCVAHLFHMSLTTLYYSGLLERVWPSGDHAGRELRLQDRGASSVARGAVKKYLRHGCYEYLFFPVLAGNRAMRVALGNFASSRLRDAFTSMSIIVNHVGAETRSYPESARAEGKADWYAMQVESSRSLSMPHWLSVLTGALDCHIEHHLFPELPPNRLREVSAVVEAICARFGVHYRRHSWPTALRQAWLELRRLGRTPKDRHRAGANEPLTSEASLDGLVG